MLVSDNKEPIVASVAIGTLDSTQKKERNNYIAQFHIRIAHSGTLLNDCRPVFD